MKKILIITSAGGGGHISVTEALTSYFTKEYIIETAYIFSDILGPIDPAQKITGGKLNGEQFYNYFIRKKSYTIINCMYAFGKWYYNLTRSRTEQLFTAYLKKLSPDLVISVAPLINQEIMAVTKKLTIPFVLLPTDFDCTSFVTRIKNSEHHPAFACVVPFINKNIVNSLNSSGIHSDQIHIGGFPLRSDFFEEKNIEELKNYYLIPEHKPVILLLMGAIGSQETLTYMKYLIQLPVRAHIIIALGKNKKLRFILEKLRLPSSISITILDYTNRISDLMAISDFIITKSGTVSVCEAIYMNLPMLLDNTGSCLNWEKMNHQIIKELKFGESILKKSDIIEQVTNFLQNRRYLKSLRSNLINYPKPNPQEELHKTITKLIT